MKIVHLYLSFLLLSSCGTTNSSGNGDPTLEGTYTVTQVGEKDLTSENLIFTFDKEEKRISGQTGCNGISAEYTQEKSQITFSAPISTKKFCEGKMEVERRIHTAIEEAAEFKRKGTTYIFYSEDNTPLLTLTKTSDRE